MKKLIALLLICLCLQPVSADISSASYDSKSFSVASQDTNSGGLWIKPDGTKFYFTGINNDFIYQYSMSTPWDISTGSYDSKSCNMNSSPNIDTPHGVCANDDGSIFYVINAANDTIYELDLSTAWDVSTCSAGGTYVLESESHRNCFFHPTGDEFYVIGVGSDKVYTHSMSTAYDVTTASNSTEDGDVSAQLGVPTGVYFNDNGTTMWVVGRVNDTVYEYDLSTAWDPSSETYSTNSFSVATQATYPKDIIFKHDDGSKFYILDDTNDTIYQYSSGVSWTLDEESVADNAVFFGANF